MADPPDLATTLRAGYADALDAAFLVEPGGKQHTYREVEAMADRFAGALAGAGVRPGDRVVVQAEKSTASVALYLGCVRMGAIYVPLNPAFTETERRFFLDDAQPAALVTDPRDPPPEDVATLTLGADGHGTLVDAAGAADPLPSIAPASPDDVAAMLYTSGTTGRPKGAMLSNRALVANGSALRRLWGFGPADVLVHPLPIFHTHGLFVALHCAMLSGGEVRFLPRFDVDAVLTALRGATVMMAVPTIYARLLDDTRFDHDACSSVRLFTSGSAPMTEVMHHQVTERTGHRIVERYGMTEAGIISSNPLDGERVPGTVGFALPGYEIGVRAGGRNCAPGQTGVVEIRGPHLFSGYWRLPDKTAAEFTDDGYFVTGDMGCLDGEGRLTLQGRSSDMIISGGENIYPKEIERCLDQCPGIVESAVVGLPDATFGEAVTAFVVVDGTYDQEQVREQLGESLARFKHPKRYIVIDELPRNAMGKVQKNLLRQNAAGST